MDQPSFQWVLQKIHQNSMYAQIKEFVLNTYAYDSIFKKNQKITE